VSSRHCARLGSILPTVLRNFFFAFLMFKYYFFIVWEYLLSLPKSLEMPSTGTPKIPRFKINFSMCEYCCLFFIFCLFLAFQRKVRILTTQKSLTALHLVNFYRWFQSTTLSDHLSFFSLLDPLKPIPNFSISSPNFRFHIKLNIEVITKHFLSNKPATQTSQNSHN
jgi:hypothetical protein